MAIKDSSAPALTFAGFLVFAALGIFFSGTQNEATSRPNENDGAFEQVLEDCEIPARLWQDPFSAIKTYLGSHDSDLFTKCDIEDQYKTKDINALVKHTVGAKDHKENTIVLGIMVNSSPYATQAESRRMRRYAVVSALGEAGFIPAKHQTVFTKCLRSNKGNENNKCIGFLPYETFNQEEKSSNDDIEKVVVLWLDDHYFGPEKFELIDEQAAYEGTTKKPKFFLMGPNSSNQLSDLIQQKANNNDNKNQINIFSPFATIPNGILTSAIENASTKNKDPLILDFSKLKEKFNIVRTILTDDILIRALIDELAARQIPPATNRKTEPKYGTIVLISEWDTSFGRALPKSFEQQFCDKNSPCNRLKLHTYLRGVDGIAPGVIDASLATSSTDKNSSDNLILDDTASHKRRPIGTAQYDYIRRLTEKLITLDKELYQKHKKGIVAVGILGTDVYDKLVILRTLRARLPSTIFFTTDLDAQLFHPSDFPWTRNLIVASSFGLQLGEDFQKSTPPFRNSYQTSLFFAVQLALKSHSKPQDFVEKYVKNLKPQLFEIGRDGPYNLNYDETYKSSGEKTLNINNNNLETVIYPKLDEGWKGEYFLLLYIFALIIISVFALNHKWSVVYGLLAFIAFVSICIGLRFFHNSHPEPFSLFNGISIWPTILIRLACIAIALLFICMSSRHLQQNMESLSLEYFSISLDKKRGQNFCSLGARPWRFLALLVLFIFTFLALGLARSKAESLGIAGVLFAMSIVLVHWYFLVVYIFRLHPLFLFSRTIESWTQKPLMSAKLLWVRYSYFNSRYPQAVRVLTCVIFYTAIVMCIFLLFGSQPPPARGAYAFSLYKLATILNVVTMLIVIFYVIDVSRTCMIWIDGLTLLDLDWQSSTIQDKCHELGIKSRWAKDWICVHMIAKRTKMIGGMIYLPFLIIFLTLFARMNYFDNWTFHQALAIVVMMNLLLAILNAFQLKSSAERARRNILNQLELDKISSLSKDPPTDYPTHAQINELIDNISNLKEGAYLPLLQQPVVKACVLLLGAVGLSVSQYQSLMG